MLPVGRLSLAVPAPSSWYVAGPGEAG
jgi:hypothetical protein